MSFWSTGAQFAKAIMGVAHVPAGTSVTIARTNFGDSQGTSTVTFSRTPTTPRSIKDLEDEKQ